MGRVPVIVVRGSGGEVRALLNSCRHRGTKLCRGEAGNARHFVCPYHGWSYEIDGRLITTTYDEHLPPGMDKADWGLVPAPRVETYKGLVFAAWDPGVPPLRDYLGDIAWYLDALFSSYPRRDGGARAAASLAHPRQLEDRRAQLHRRQPARAHHPCRAGHPRQGAVRERRVLCAGGRQLPGRHRRGPRLHPDLPRPRHARRELSHPSRRRCATPMPKCWAPTGFRCSTISA